MFCMHMYMHVHVHIYTVHEARVFGGEWNVCIYMYMYMYDCKNGAKKQY